MHGFQMLLRVTIAALTTAAAVVVCSMKINAMICVRSTS